ncbi:MAG: hypothetical protein EXS05_02860 [Planctomycetaceae bacterium]|nr:hypothetical protein [Planctomycetaceae bacterium]
MEPSDLLTLLSHKLDELGISYLVTGSMATIAYGEPRFTNDIDVVISLRPEDVTRFCEAFPMPEFYVSQEAVKDAVRERRQFNIIHPASGLKVDGIIPKDDDFERSRQQRGVRLPVVESVEAMFASAEDVIIRKMQYFQAGGSDKHLRDIAGVLKIQGDRIDRRYIVEWSDRLAVRDVWELILKQVGGS